MILFLCIVFPLNTCLPFDSVWLLSTLFKQIVLTVSPNNGMAVAKYGDDGLYHPNRVIKHLSAMDAGPADANALLLKRLESVGHRVHSKPSVEGRASSPKSPQGERKKVSIQSTIGTKRSTSPNQQRSNTSSKPRAKKSAMLGGVVLSALLSSQQQPQASSSSDPRTSILLQHHRNQQQQKRQGKLGHTATDIISLGSQYYLDRKFVDTRPRYANANFIDQDDNKNSSKTPTAATGNHRQQLSPMSGSKYSLHHTHGSMSSPSATGADGNTATSVQRSAKYYQQKYQQLQQLLSSSTISGPSKEVLFIVRSIESIQRQQAQEQLEAKLRKKKARAVSKDIHSNSGRNNQQHDIVGSTGTRSSTNVLPPKALAAAAGSTKDINDESRRCVLACHCSLYCVDTITTSIHLASAATYSGPAICRLLPALTETTLEHLLLLKDPAIEEDHELDVLHRFYSSTSPASLSRPSSASRQDGDENSGVSARIKAQKKASMQGGGSMKSLIQMSLSKKGGTSSKKNSGPKGFSSTKQGGGQLLRASLTETTAHHQAQQALSRSLRQRYADLYQDRERTRLLDLHATRIQRMARGYVQRKRYFFLLKQHILIRRMVCARYVQEAIMQPVFNTVQREITRAKETFERQEMLYEDLLMQRFTAYQRTQSTLMGLEAMHHGLKQHLGRASILVPLLDDYQIVKKWCPTYTFTGHALRDVLLRRTPLRRLFTVDQWTQIAQFYPRFPEARGLIKEDRAFLTDPDLVRIFSRYIVTAQRNKVTEELVASNEAKDRKRREIRRQALEKLKQQHETPVQRAQRLLAMSKANEDSSNQAGGGNSHLQRLKRLRGNQGNGSGGGDGGESFVGYRKPGRNLWREMMVFYGRVFPPMDCDEYLREKLPAAPVTRKNKHPPLPRSDNQQSRPGTSSNATIAAVSSSRPSTSASTMATATMSAQTSRPGTKPNTAGSTKMSSSSKPGSAALGKVSTPAIVSGAEDVTDAAEEKEEEEPYYFPFDRLYGPSSYSSQVFTPFRPVYRPPVWKTRRHSISDPCQLYQRVLQAPKIIRGRAFVKRRMSIGPGVPLTQTIANVFRMHQIPRPLHYQTYESMQYASLSERVHWRETRETRHARLRRGEDVSMLETPFDKLRAVKGVAGLIQGHTQRATELQNSLSLFTERHQSIIDLRELIKNWVDMEREGDNNNNNGSDRRDANNNGNSLYENRRRYIYSQYAMQTRGPHSILLAPRLARDINEVIGNPRRRRSMSGPAERYSRQLELQIAYRESIADLVADGHVELMLPRRRRSFDYGEERDFEAKNLLAGYLGFVVEKAGGVGNPTGDLGNASSLPSSTSASLPGKDDPAKDVGGFKVTLSSLTRDQKDLEEKMLAYGLALHDDATLQRVKDEDKRREKAARKRRRAMRSGTNEEDDEEDSEEDSEEESDADEKAEAEAVERKLEQRNARKRQRDAFLQQRKERRAERRHFSYGGNDDNKDGDSNKDEAQSLDDLVGGGSYTEGQLADRDKKRKAKEKQKKGGAAGGPKHRLVLSRNKASAVAAAAESKKTKQMERANRKKSHAGDGNEYGDDSEMVSNVSPMLWQEHYYYPEDGGDAQVYYYHPSSGQSVWSVDEVYAYHRSQSYADPDLEWETQQYDENTGRWYWFNSSTGLSRWVDEETGAGDQQQYYYEDGSSVEDYAFGAETYDYSSLDSASMY